MRSVAVSLALLASTGLCLQSYNETFSQTAVYYSSATFCVNEDLEHWKCGRACSMVPGVTQLTRVESGGIFGYVAYNAESD